VEAVRCILTASREAKTEIPERFADVFWTMKGMIDSLFMIPPRARPRQEVDGNPHRNCSSGL